MPSTRAAAPTAVTLRHEGVELEVLTAGAAVRRLVLHEADGAVDLALGHQDPGTYVAHGGYLGASIGRVANRLRGGAFEMAGRGYRVVTNEGPNTLHGGLRGFDKAAWRLTHVASDEAVLTLRSPDGDQGFPGELTASVTYRLSPREVTIVYEARSLAPTVVNLTNHTYFNLDGEGSGPVTAHTLQVFADDYTPVDQALLTTGEIAPVAGTPFDLRRPTLLADALAMQSAQLEYGGGFDHNLIPRGEGLRPVAVLTGRSGRRLEVSTDQAGLQVYTGAHFDGTAIGLSGGRYERNAGIALETQGLPDAPNHPGFPSIRLDPDSSYLSTTTWQLTSAEG